MGSEHARQPRISEWLPVVPRLSSFEMSCVVPGLTHISNQETAAQKTRLPAPGGPAALQALDIQAAAKQGLIWVWSSYPFFLFFTPVLVLISLPSLAPVLRDFVFLFWHLPWSCIRCPLYTDGVPAPPGGRHGPKCSENTKYFI